MDQHSTSALDAALSPFERASESVFGILMAISVTAAFEITVGKDVDTRELMIAALGCNLAWGLIDAVMYLLQQQFDRYRQHRIVVQLHAAGSEDEFRRVVRDASPPLLAEALTPDAFARIRELTSRASEKPSFWPARELAVAGLICLIVFASTFPLVVPFMLMQDPWLAMRASHAVAAVMLFWLGWGLGRWSGASPLASGVVFATVGVVLAVSCIALGG
ncbi:MAG TPA: hypothetical protein VF110_11305 [Burkholderiales bacterium]